MKDNRAHKEAPNQPLVPPADPPKKDRIYAIHKVSASCVATLLLHSSRVVATGSFELPAATGAAALAGDKASPPTAPPSQPRDCTIWISSCLEPQLRD